MTTFETGKVRRELGLTDECLHGHLQHQNFVFFEKKKKQTVVKQLVTAVAGAVTV